MSEEEPEREVWAVSQWWEKPIKWDGKIDEPDYYGQSGMESGYETEGEA